MFGSLGSRLQATFKKLTGFGHLRAEHIDDALREIRLTLIEADVSLEVIRKISAQIKERTLGQKILESVNPAQMVIKSVHDAIVEALSAPNPELKLGSRQPAVIVMVGLQGSGKTTTSAKLARVLSKEDRRILLASLDVYRPAAQEQLAILAKQLNVDCIPPSTDTNVNEIVTTALKEATRGYDALILDTAGRSQLDESLMSELKEVVERVRPAETLLVIDAGIGQEAVSVARAFNQAVSLSGVILSKADGDARAGAALSITSATGLPIKFVGTGEKLSDIIAFDPKSIASRIFAQDDIVSLVEKAKELENDAEVKDSVAKMMSGKFNLNDLYKQIQAMKKLGGVSALMKALPQAQRVSVNEDDASNKIERQLAIINSMTREERKHPDILNASRKIRIARGSGTSVQEINKLLKGFVSMRGAIKQMKPGMLKNLL